MRYWKCFDIYIRVLSNITNIFFKLAGFVSTPFYFRSKHLTIQLRCLTRSKWMSDIVYRIKAYSDLRYNIGLGSLQSDIRGSDIRLSPISLNMNAHLWSLVTVNAFQSLWFTVYPKIILFHNAKRSFCESRTKFTNLVYVDKLRNLKTYI
jgi:hypothetical protein